MKGARTPRKRTTVVGQMHTQVAIWETITVMATTLRAITLIRTESGGGERDRTADPRLAKPVLSQTELRPQTVGWPVIGVPATGSGKADARTDGGLYRGGCGASRTPLASIPRPIGG